MSNTIQHNSKAYTAHLKIPQHMSENSIRTVAPSSSALQERGFADKIEMVERTGSEAYYMYFMFMGPCNINQCQ